MNKLSHYDIALVDAAEKMLLNATDSEVIAASKEVPSLAQKNLRRIILRHCEAPKKSQQRKAATEREVKKIKGSKPSLLLEFLRNLAQAQPDFSPTLAATFSANRKPKREEVEKLVVDILEKELKRKI